MQDDLTIVIGGGLSGLAVAAGLTAQRRPVLVLEARARLGGRILGLRLGDADRQHGMVDAGPAWIWPHNRRMLSLVADLGLETFPQHAHGRLVAQGPDGAVRRDLDFAPMAGSLRVVGGLSRIIDGLAERIGTRHIHPGQAHVDAIDLSPTGNKVQGRSPGGAFAFACARVVSTVPPRVFARDISVSPALPKDLTRVFQTIPTWMAGHAKVLASYPTPFWRTAGLSGDAISQRGPLAEIHDASPADDSFGALFGFVGVTAQDRADAGADLKQAAIDQLTALFGADAAHPTDVTLTDWAQDRQTATTADWVPPAGHPHYARPRAVDAVATQGLHFAGTELAPDEGGFLEGALSAAEAVLSAL